MHYPGHAKFQDWSETEYSENPGHIPNLLMIAGTGRKVGKTTLACELIWQTSLKYSVIAIKISPHFHEQAPGQHFIAQNSDYHIIEETNPNTAKDSSRMLQAGACKVYYIQTNDSNLYKTLSLVFKLVPNNLPMICESGALLRYAKPGLFLLVKPPDGQSTKKGLEQLAYQPDDWLIFDGQNFNRDLKTYQFENECWKKMK